MLTFDGRAAWDVQTRFDFHWDPQRFRDPAAILARIKANSLRVCVWEYPYVSIHSPLFQELADKHYLLKTADGEPYVFGWDTSPGTSPFGDVLTSLPESGLVDFTNPAAYAWWRDAHRPLFEAGVDVIKSDFGEHVPEDAVAFNGDRGKRLHNVYPLLYNRCIFEATRKVRRARHAAHGLEPRWMDRQPAIPDPVGRRPAERLGRSRRERPRRAVVGHERRPLSRHGHRRILRFSSADA